MTAYQIQRTRAFVAQYLYAQDLGWKCSFWGSAKVYPDKKWCGQQYASVVSLIPLKIVLHDPRESGHLSHPALINEKLLKNYCQDIQISVALKKGTVHQYHSLYSFELRDQWELK